MAHGYILAGTESATQLPRIEWEKKLRLVGRKILVMLCENDHVRDDEGKVLVFLPDEQKEVMDPAGGPSWAEILLVSPQCKEFSQVDVGRFVLTPRRAHGINDIGDYYLIIDEAAIERIESVTRREAATHERSKYRVQPFTVEAPA